MASKSAATYRHEDEAPVGPDVGTQAQFKQQNRAKTYKYDSSLSPALDWDGLNSAREREEELIRRMHLTPALLEDVAGLTAGVG